MEDQNRVQSAELCACSSQVETNDNRVKDDTEFEDEESSDLLAERALDEDRDGAGLRVFAASEGRNGCWPRWGSPGGVELFAPELGEQRGNWTQGVGVS